MWVIVKFWADVLIGCVFLYKECSVYSNYDIRYLILLVFVMSVSKMCEIHYSEIQRNINGYGKGRV